MSASGAGAQVMQATGDSIVPQGNVKFVNGIYYRLTSLIFGDVAVAGFMKGIERDSINIPSEIYDSIAGRTVHVTSIASDAFKGCTGLKDVVIPNSVTRIGSGAFEGCSLQKVVVPGSVYHVEQNAFADNPLKEVYIYSPGVEGTSDISHSVELQDKAFGSADGSLTDVHITYPDPPIVDDGAKPFPQVAAHHGSATLHLPDGADTDAYKNAYGWSDFFADPPTAIESVGTDNAVPARYYTLGGVEIAASRLTPGIYIVQRGNSAVKTLVR